MRPDWPPAIPLYAAMYRVTMTGMTYLIAEAVMSPRLNTGGDLCNGFV
jgi:hypothetical protein